MRAAVLRQVGGSVMLAVPPALLDVLQVRSGSTVDLAIDDGRLIVVPRRPPSYALEDLIAQCDPTAPPDDEDRAWIDGAAVGEELL
ncbi:MAG: antitoxin [bacterium]|nr:antitoxin [bacterium]